MNMLHKNETKSSNLGFIYFKNNENDLVALYDNWWLVAYCASHVSQRCSIPAELSAIKHKCEYK